MLESHPEQVVDKVSRGGQSYREKEALTDHTTQPIIPRLTLKGKPEGDHSMSEYTGCSKLHGRRRGGMKRCA